MVQNQRGFLNSAEITKIIAPIPLKKRKSWRDSKRSCIAKGKPLVQKKRKERNLDKNQNIQGEKKEKKKHWQKSEYTLLRGHCGVHKTVVWSYKVLFVGLEKIASFSKEYSQGCFHYMSYLSATKSQQDWHGQESLLQSSIIFLQPSSPPQMGKKYLLVIFSSQDALRLFGTGEEAAVNNLFDIFVSDMGNSNPSFQGEGTPFTGTLI